MNLNFIWVIALCSTVLLCTVLGELLVRMRRSQLYSNRSRSSSAVLPIATMSWDPDAPGRINRKGVMRPHTTDSSFVRTQQSSEGELSTFAPPAELATNGPPGTDDASLRTLPKSVSTKTAIFPSSGSLVELADDEMASIMQRDRWENRYNPGSRPRTAPSTHSSTIIHDHDVHIGMYQSQQGWVNRTKSRGNARCSVGIAKLSQQKAFSLVEQTYLPSEVESSWEGIEAHSRPKPHLPGQPWAAEKQQYKHDSEPWRLVSPSTGMETIEPPDCNSASRSFSSLGQPISPSTAYMWAPRRHMAQAEGSKQRFHQPVTTAHEGAEAKAWAWTNNGRYSPRSSTQALSSVLRTKGNSYRGISYGLNSSRQPYFSHYHQKQQSLSPQSDDVGPRSASVRRQERQTQNSSPTTRKNSLFIPSSRSSMGSQWEVANLSQAHQRLPTTPEPLPSAV